MKITNIEPSYNVVFLKGFIREFEKLSDIHRKMVTDKILILKLDPFYPSLRTKKMNGNSGNYESSVNMDIRILWQFDDNNIILLVDVGHHDVLKKY